MTLEDKQSATSSDAGNAPLDVVTDALGPATVQDDADGSASDGAAGHEDSKSDPAQSSSAKDGEKSPKQPTEKDLLSVVRDAVEKKPEAKEPTADQKPKDGSGEGASSATGKAENQDKQDKSKSAEGDTADPTEEELKGYKPETRKRIESLLSQRSELRERLGEVEPAAEQYGKITSYMQENGLTANDVATAMTLTTMFKHDPERAREELQKRIDVLDQVIGNRLPDDLKKKVDDGLMDEDAARELSRARAAAARERQRSDAYEQGYVRNEQQRQTQEIKSRVQTAVTGWQQSKIQTDPDYQRKAPLLDRYVRAMVAEKGQPKTPEDALKMADEAYSMVNRDLGALKPAVQPQAKRVVQSRHVSGNPRPTASNPLDVVKQAVEGRK